MSNQSILTKEVDPFAQAAYVLAGVILLTLLFMILNWVGISKTQPYLPWSMSASGLLFFAIFNSVMSLSFENQNRYWFRSILAYLLLMLVGGLFAYFLSGLSINEAMSFQWLYLVFTIGYLAFLSIVRMMRKIVIIVKKQDKRLRGED